MKYLISIFVFIAMLSCENSTSELKNSSTNPFDGNSKKIYTTINPSNSNNPYDSNGIVHNLVLDHIISNKTSFDCDSNHVKTTIKQLIASYENNSFYQIPQSNLSDSINNLVDEYLNYGRYLSISSFYARYNTSLNVQNEINVIIGIVNQYNNNVSVINILDSIRLRETFIIYNQFYTQNEKTLILGAASVARYSLVYWDEVNNSQNSDWFGDFLPCRSKNHSNENPQLQTNNTTADIAGVVASDIAGFVSGGPVGAATGSAVAAICIYWGDAILKWFGL